MITPLVLAAAVSVPSQVPASSSRRGPRACQELREQIGGRARWCAESGAGRPSARQVPLADIAQRFAPILWFSPNEPLLWADPGAIKKKWQDAGAGRHRSCSLENIPGGSTIRIPHRLPGDDQDGPAVYYQLIEYDRGRDPFDPKTETVDLTDLHEIHLRYFFYYLCDIGANAHPDDLEALQFTLRVVRDGECRRLEIAHITGFAHGLEWVYNRLAVEAPRRSGGAKSARLLKAGDLLLPVTVLVEEGKHASSPDRNGDGVFTPGYDVNERVAEAWGVRDNFGSGLIVPKYHAEDSKRRDPDHRIFPGGLDAGDPLLEYYRDCSSPAETWPVAGSARDAASGEDARDASGQAAPTYALQSAHAVPDLASAQGLGDGDFGDRPRRHDFLREKASVLVHRTSINARWDQPVKFAVGDSGKGLRARWPNQLTLTLPGIRPGPLPVWLAARGTFNIDRTELTPHRFQRIDVLVLPSAARWFDSYIALWGYSRGENAQLLPEVGYRIRLVSKEPPFRFPRGLAQIVPLLGLRVGLRLPSLPRLLGIDRPGQDGARAVRIVVEFGGGAF